MSLRQAVTSRVQSLWKKTPEEPLEDVSGAPDIPRRADRPTRSFSVFFEHLKKLGFAPTTCIDVGAAIGTKTIYEAFPDAKHIVFEPLPDFLTELKKTLEPYEHVIHECVLSDEVGELTLLRHNDLFGSSIMHNRDGADERVMTVRASMLDKEINQGDLAGPVLLKTDCQGSDLMVLKGGTETLRSCEVVIVEASLFRFWGQHQPDFYDIVTFMNGQGFALYDILDGLFRPVDSALGQVDLAFVKERGMFRRHNHW